MKRLWRSPSSVRAFDGPPSVVPAAADGKVFGARPRRTYASRSRDARDSATSVTDWLPVESSCSVKVVSS